MSIILRENEWASNMLAMGTLGKKPSETLKRTARYYLDEGYSSKEVRSRLESFIRKCDPSCSIVKWTAAIDYAIKRAAKQPAVNIEKIAITKPEMKKIESLEGRQIQRLAFTLLCLSKYWKIVFPASDGWVNNKDNEIMAMANINTSIKRQSLMYGTLKEREFIQFSKKVDNTNVRVCFAEDGDIVLEISDFRCLGYQYLKYHGEPYIECQCCGITTKLSNPEKGKKQKYCKDCAAKIAVKQRVDSVMRQRGVTGEG